MNWLKSKVINQQNVKRPLCNAMSCGCHVDVHYPLFRQVVVQYLQISGPALWGVGPNWKQFQSAQVPSQLAPRSVLVCTWQAEGRLHSSAGPPRHGAQLGAIGPIGLRLALANIIPFHYFHRASTHDVVDHLVDPTWWIDWTISHSIQWSTTCVKYAVVCTSPSVE